MAKKSKRVRVSRGSLSADGATKAEAQKVLWQRSYSDAIARGFSPDVAFDLASGLQRNVAAMSAKPPTE